MSQRPETNPFCVECHWEDHHMTNNSTLSAAECFDLMCWNGANGADYDSGHPLICDTAVECCDMGDCSRDCATVCDGFVDCDKATVCSESYCDNLNCQNTGTACFDEDCIGTHFDSFPQHSHDDDFLAQEGSLNWNCLGLESTNNGCGFNNGNFGMGFPSHGHTNGTFSSSQIPSSNRELAQSHLYGQSSLTNHSQSVSDPCFEHGLGGICISNTIDPCHSFSDCTYPRKAGTNPSLGGCSETSTLLASLHASRIPQHRYNYNEPSFQSLASQLCHRHQETTTAATTSARTTPSLSIQSSPISASLCREASISSMFENSDLIGNDELHICRWVDQTSDHRICGALFSDAGSLQKHLTTTHADPTKGSQGQGYYCCWEGCSRPNEPFSQKSKLQGHFLTHSNCMSYFPLPIFATTYTYTGKG